MKKTSKMMLTVLRSMYEVVTSIGNGLYLVKAYRERYGDDSWGIYSSRSRKVVLWGNKYERLSPDLISFERTDYYSGNSGSYTENYLFSLQKTRVVDFGEYRGSSFELCKSGYVKAYFLKTVKKGDDFDIVGGWGVFDVEKEDFIIHPQYDKMIPLGNSQYYVIKKDRRTGKETYFLMEIDDPGKVATQKTSKIA